MMLVGVEWLADNLNDSDLRIVDCRYILGKPGEGHQAYLRSHIPGAIHLDIDKDLSASRGPGRHPLPNLGNFSKTISQAGIDHKIQVVAYDDIGGGYAARLWWLLQYCGHNQVFLLNGGWIQWIANNYPIENSVPEVKPRPFKISLRQNCVVSKEYVAQVHKRSGVLLLDARAPERYRGESEPIDSKAGHIPGAVNAFFMDNIKPTDKTFKNKEELKMKFETYGYSKAREIISYCGSGVTACHNIFVLNLLGLEAKLYEGSWSEWSADDKLPIAVGK